MPPANQPLARLARAYPQQTLEAATFQVYLEDLTPIPGELLAEAVTFLIRTSERFPTIRAIRTTCAEIALALPTETQALAIVDVVLGGETVECGPIWNEAVALVGGLRTLRTSREPTVVRGQFCRYYRELRAAAIQAAALRDGIVEPGVSRAALRA